MKLVHLNQSKKFIHNGKFNIDESQSSQGKHLKLKNACTMNPKISSIEAGSEIIIEAYLREL